MVAVVQRKPFRDGVSCLTRYTRRHEKDARADPIVTEKLRLIQHLLKDLDQPLLIRQSKKLALAPSRSYATSPKIR